MLLDIQPGDRFILTLPDTRGTFEVREGDLEQSIALQQLEGEAFVEFPVADFALMQAEGEAISIFKAGQEVPRLSSDMLLGSVEKFENRYHKFTPGESKKKSAIQKKIQKAATVIFYVQRAVECNDTKKSTRKLEKFILDNYNAAKDLGFTWIPSPSTIRKALASGAADVRTFSQFALQKGRHKKQGFVHDLRRRAVARYWTIGSVNYKGSIDWFDIEYFKYSRENPTEKIGKRPSDTTLREDINRARCHATIKTKFGGRIADRQTRARGKSREALRPLEFVVMDQTLANIWLTIKRDDGTVLTTNRPWLVCALDVFSRGVVAFVLTFEPPSVATITQCLLQVIRPKTNWVKRFGSLKGATDFFGMPSTIILDNGRENIGKSMKMGAMACGIDIEYAPKGTPEYKSWVERLFSTIEELWATLPGGWRGDIRKLEESGVYPRREACLTLAQVAGILEQRIVTGYHLDVHSGIGMQPARKWNAGVKEFKRPMVQDAKTLRFLLGKHTTGALTAEGIWLHGQEFYDQELVTYLLDVLVHKIKKREQRKGDNQTRTVRVNLVFHDLDCSEIAVEDPTTKTMLFFKNKVEFLAKAHISYDMARKLDKDNDKANVEFDSGDDRAERLEAEIAAIADAIPTQPYKEAKRSVRRLEESRRPLMLEDGIIVETTAPPSVEGMENYDTPVGLALTDQEGAWIPLKAPKRSGKKKVEKPDKISNETLSPAPSASPPDALAMPNSDEETEDDFWINDSEARLDELARRSIH